MKNIKSLSISTSATVIVVTILTIWSELSGGFKEILKSLTGHHWTTKGVIAFVIFFGLYFILARKDDNSDVMKEVLAVTIITILAFLIIFGFYLWHFFA